MQVKINVTVILKMDESKKECYSNTKNIKFTFKQN